MKAIVENGVLKLDKGVGWKPSNVCCTFIAFCFFRQRTPSSLTLGIDLFKSLINLCAKIGTYMYHVRYFGKKV